MISEFAPAFQGPLAFAGDSLVLGQEARPTVAVKDLLQPGMIGELVEAFSRRYPGGDHPAVLSMWSQYYMSVLVYPVLSVALALRRELPVAPEDVSLVIGDDGAPTALLLPHAGRPLPDGPIGAASLNRLVRGHLEPVVQALASAGRVSARVFWCNAGVRIGDVLRLLGDMAGSHEVRDRLLHQDCWEDGWTNPLARSFHPSACLTQPSPQRRVCCMRYRLPGLERGCGTCPLPEIRQRHLH
ncbi:siderophore-iron reductase FhuF [Teichococcus oryzae]|uniref:Siderophore-iron reductase FhuF n=1 Tax=Teichococcus oryzae TaxID=1608942 RepID=A0A5B2TF72_9PROT|nr:siderophore-iron reductase FhuF [Pseudoroseomonas oryzae]KAA2212460.1 siderophore-iron reductase FhuF [Pseudoroseomonas oryzae]